MPLEWSAGEAPLIRMRGEGFCQGHYWGTFTLTISEMNRCFNSRVSGTLLGIDLLHPFDRIRLFRQLVRTQPNNPREAQGVSTLVPGGIHLVVEGHFQHNLRLDHAPE